MDGNTETHNGWEHRKELLTIPHKTTHYINNFD